MANLLLKANNKGNSKIYNSVKTKVMDIAIRSWIAIILIFLSRTGPGPLNQVFDRLREKKIAMSLEKSIDLWINKRSKVIQMIKNDGYWS